MHSHDDSSIRFKRLTVLLGLLTSLAWTGCSGGAGDALPGASTVKRDAAVKRDTTSATSGVGGTGGAGGGAVVASTGGGGGTTEMGGAGGAATSIPDSGATRDLVPDGVPDVAPDTQRGPDSGSQPIEASISVDVGRETGAGQDLSPQDAPWRDAADAPVGTGDGPADLADLAKDLSLDIPADVSADLSPNNDLSPDSPPDLAMPDLAPDLGSGPTCTNPAWAKQLSFRPAQPGWLSGDKEGNLFLANTLFDTVDFGGTAGTLISAGNSDSALVRFDSVTGNAVWAAKFGDNAAQTATGLAVDNAGHVAFIGRYEGTLTVGPSILANTAAWADSYVGVVDATAGTGLWAKTVALRDANSTQTTQGLAAIAANPNVDGFVVCGYASILATDLVTDPGATVGGGYDIVVAKVTVTGSGLAVAWARQIGGPGDQKCTAAAVDDNGNVVIAGTYTGQLNFGTGAFSPAGAANVVLPWIAKLNKDDGSTLMAVNIPPASGVTGAVPSTVNSIDIDSNGNVALSGSFRKSLVFGTTTLTSASVTSLSTLSDAFAAKFTSTLTPVWAKSWGNPSDAKSQSIAYGIAFDSSGNLALAGNFNSTIALGPSGGMLTAASSVDPLLGSQTDNADIVVGRLSGADGSTQCATRFGDYGGQTVSGLFIPRQATGAAKDVPFASGILTSTLDFGTASLSTEGSSSGLTYFWLARF